MTKLETILEWLRWRTKQGEFKEFLSQSLLSLCKIKTVPIKDIKEIAKNETLTFKMIEKLIRSSGLPGLVKQYPILPSIQSHPFFTFPYYTDSTDAYNGRYNLVYLWDSPRDSVLGRKVAVNAHIDTVTPYLQVSRKDDTIFGRGTCDDKSGCTVMMATLLLLKEIKDQFNVVPGSDLTFMFVIDEETGGNGSLSLALDKDLKERYDTVVVLECCDQQIYPANRGGLWYKIEIPPRKISHQIILGMEIIQELEKEGAMIREESSHPLFPQRPVQTSYGIFGPFGEHPSRICGYIAFLLKTVKSGAELNRCAEMGVKRYEAQYGDKTKIIDPETRRAMLDRHYEIVPQNDQFLLEVWGKTGHMGSIRENDNALTKASFIIMEIAGEDPRLEIDFTSEKVRDSLVIEGGQGFIPSHTIEQIMKRLSDAMYRAYDRSSYWWGDGFPKPLMTFEKIKNDAFAGDPNSQSMVNAIKCAELIGIPIKKPIVGFESSCDAHLFAKLYPGLEVITTGPGRLKDAHSDEEQINVNDLAKSCAMLTLFLLVHTQARNLEDQII